MRVTLLLPILMLATSAMAAPGRDDQLKPVSLQLAAAGQAALADGKPQDAIDSFEAALASDPRNVAAFAGIAAAYEKLGLPGKAIKYYREALAMNPSDIGALEGQGRALVARGATARAQINVARIKALCKTDCSAATRLEGVIAKASQQASVVPAKPAIERN
ncbi:tetratricopeptide repeat protein [Sandarakinorhabdus sp. AAP62]|uniref:tetratricopeptide repeat protein n=1 Tax=Sandarakinorhabdus sp. AAP62 TaxID=1248916 RepID=UPI0002DF874C|nr:tetratricopeptide repeat protein [Sandarakinorhabdus sp. AAP62]